MIVDTHSSEYLYERFQECFGSPGVPLGSAELGSVVCLDVESENPSLPQQIAKVAESASLTQPRALVIGPQDMQSAEANAAVASLIGHRESLHCLEGIFLGALEFRHFHENEIINVRHLLESFPGLRVFGLHDGYGGWDEQPFTLKGVRHIGLETLLYQSHQDAQSFAVELGQSVFPNLQRMTLKVTGDYRSGGAYLRALFTNEYPALQHLTIPGSQDADDIATLLTSCPLLGQLETLDLSGGWLTDDGVQALRDASNITTLRELTIHGHYASPETIAGLQPLSLTLHHTPVESDDEDWDNVKQARLVRRIRPHAGEEYIIRLDCLPHLELSVLSEVVIEGKVRFFDDIMEKEYLGEVLDNPTWLDMALEANRMQRTVGDYHHVFMEEWWADQPDPELAGVMRGGMTFGS